MRPKRARKRRRDAVVVDQAGKIVARERAQASEAGARERAQAGEAKPRVPAQTTGGQAAQAKPAQQAKAATTQTAKAAPAAQPVPEGMSKEDEDRMRELEAQVEALTTQLEESEDAEPSSSNDDQTKALLQLSELISVRYNPFLQESEQAIFDDQDAQTFLSKLTGGSIDAATMMGDTPRGRNHNAPQAAAPQPELAPPPAEERPGAGIAEIVHDEPASVRDEALKAIWDDMDDSAHATPLEEEAQMETQAGKWVVVEPPAAPEVQDLEAEGASKTTPAVSSIAPGSHLAPMVGSPSADRIKASSRQAHLMLRWFSEMARIGDPSEIHLFVDHYEAIGWIPEDHVYWVRAMAQTVAPRAETTWADLHMHGVDVAQMHMRNLRFFEDVFNRRDTDPAGWEDEADRLLGGD